MPEQLRLRTRVKFCGLVRPADVDAATSLGVDAIGFVFYPRSPRAIDGSEAARLRRRLPSWVSAVGLFVDETPERVRHLTDEVGLDVVQFHGNESPDVCRASLPGRVPFWRAVRMRGSGDLLESERVYDEAEAFLVDSFSEKFGGSGTRFDWSWIPRDRGRRLILSGGLDETTVGEAVASVAPHMVDVSSGIQGADPRTKDPNRMARFLAAVIQADAHRIPQLPTPHRA